jgi:hypothetical protein
MKDDATSDKVVAEEGWGPTLRLSTLVLVRGLAHRLSTAREGHGGRRIVGVTAGIVGAAAGMYAKARGWI